MITEVAAYFEKGCGRCARYDSADCATRIWAPGLAALRRICLTTGLDETVKWGHPCYVLSGRNIAMIGAFRGDFCLTFFNAGLLHDNEGLLQRPGPNSAEASVMRFADTAAVALLEPVILDFLHQAMGHGRAGAKSAPARRDLVLPAELTAALEADADLAAAFAALTPGRQRSHVIALTSAKTSATRIARIARQRDRILAGKGAQER